MEFIKKSRKLILNLIKSPSTRLRFSLFFGAIINLVYLAGNLASALIYSSLWSATVTVYHFMLMIIRMYILYMGRVEQKNSLFVVFRVGIFLFIIDILAALMMAYTVNVGSSIHYGGLVLLFFLFYTVYSLTSSFFGMKKWKNDNKPLHYAARNMTFAAALMSVFNLQFSLFSTIGLNSAIKEKMIRLGGFAVFFVMIFLSFRLIIRGFMGRLR